MINLVIFLCGFLFSIGLGLSGMTQPSKVIGFLDFVGNWDPSLIMVMAGAVFVYFVGQRLTMMRDGPALVPGGFQLPTRTADFDKSMITGNILFGVGWGLVGFCPGPAIAASVTGNPAVLIFLVSMAVGMYIYGAIDTRFSTRQPDGGAGLRERAMLVALEEENKLRGLP
jgi:uncharacterized membrane protein YedE/YeeE